MKQASVTYEMSVWDWCVALLAFALLISVIGGAGYGLYRFFGVEVAAWICLPSLFFLGAYSQHKNRLNRQQLGLPPVEEKASSTEGALAGYDPETGWYGGAWSASTFE